MRGLIFYLHYLLLTSGLSGISVLLGVFFKTYSDASQTEIGLILMSFPFVSIVVKPLFCSLADRQLAHRGYLIGALLLMLLGYMPFIIVPYLPDFYTRHARASGYLLALACNLGNGALAVAWSLGDSLAVNSSLKSGVPFSRMRLVGTISWGVYGYIIGEINELPNFPKYVPAFFILQASVLLEVALLVFWDKQEFVMCESRSDDDAHQQADDQQQAKSQYDNRSNLDWASNVGSAPSSLSGTLRLRPKTAVVIRDVLMDDNFSRELSKLAALEANPNGESNQDNNNNNNNEPAATNKSTGSKFRDLAVFEPQFLETQAKGQSDVESQPERKRKSPQILVFKMIFLKDKRLVKYLVLYTLAGFLLSPMNFVFLSLEEACREKGCNFSHLAGTVLISQASIETLSFLVLPWILIRISRATALIFALAILAARYFFYAFYFYTSDISPYWALVGEWGHGISYGIFCTILADIALMFADQSRLFIPKLRHLGYLSRLNPKTSEDKAKIEAEELAIKMVLRATMQAFFSGLMDGLGQGLGSLICGFVLDAASYTTLWQLFLAISLSTALLQQLVELTNSRWSDTHKPKLSDKDLKAPEGKQISSEHQINASTQTVNKAADKQLAIC